MERETKTPRCLLCRLISKIHIYTLSVAVKDRCTVRYHMMMKSLFALGVIALLLAHPSDALLPPYVGGGCLISRSDFMWTTLSSLTPALQPRAVDVGEGVDLLSPSPRFGKPDGFFPVSMEGLWMCQRVVSNVDGDSFQANTAWKALGSKSNLPAPESYLTRFVKSPYEGDLASYTVMDRGFDYASRSGTTVDWSVREPNHLQSSNKIQLDVYSRLVELPNDQGWGSQELFKITDGPFLRAALVKRRFRRNFEGDQRVVEGLEVVKTFRVLDGVAGTEYPTSTIRSQIRLTRPRGDEADIPSGAF
eukprot:scaffold3234_cov166-Amphora_coffeaeformis.AAC.2